MTCSTIVFLATLSLSRAYLLAPVSPRTPAHAIRAVPAIATLRDDLRTAGVVALASAVLVAAPISAHAKGGGHGGGGGHSSSHSSSHHSSSSSSSRRALHSYRTTSSRSSRSSSSTSRSSRRISGSGGYTSTYRSSPPPPPPITLFPDEDSARREGGFYCPANLPRPGERVDVIGTANNPNRVATVLSSLPTSQESLYGTNGGVVQPVPGFENDCSVTVRYDDGTTGTASAAVQPVSKVEQAVDNMILAACVMYYVGGSFVGGDGSSTWRSAEERHRELLDELEATTRGTSSMPASGEYWGSSEESDEGDQAVRTALNFHDDGTVTGHGKDGVDGAYRVTRGRWGVRDGDDCPTLAWIEKYDEGFEAAVEGRYDAHTGKIEGRFTSDRGVRGAFALAPKPSVF